jgi:hypothetical protein
MTQFGRPGWGGVGWGVAGWGEVRWNGQGGVEWGGQAWGLATNYYHWLLPAATYYLLPITNVIPSKLVASIQ